MNLSEKNPVSDISPENLVLYLQSLGWRLSDNVNSRWYELVGGEEIAGRKLEIVFPQDGTVSDYETYLNKVITLVSTITKQSSQQVLRSIQQIDSDILSIKVTEKNQEYVDLDVAERQVKSIKRLIEYGVGSEFEAKPVIQNNARYKKIANRYRFGHTFRGSFGYTIFVQLPEIQQSYVQKHLPLFPEEDETSNVSNIKVVPIERRVMQRIAQGLLLTNLAARDNDVNVLVDGYLEGFDANMCKALLDIYEDEKEPIECNIQWASVLPAEPSLIAIKPIRLQRREYNLLQEAREVLRKTQPNYETIKGMVIGSLSNEDPQSDGAERSVIIRWIRDGLRTVRVRVFLNKDDYAKANEAHLTWRTIEVTGILQKSFSLWTLYSVSNFRVL